MSTYHPPTNKLPQANPNGFDRDQAIQVRIILDPANRDGWISKAIKTGRIAFIANLDTKIESLVPGQVWEAILIADGPRYSRVNLHHLTDGPMTNRAAHH